MIRVVFALALMLTTGVAGYSQSTIHRLGFEVASVKPAPPPDGRGMTVGCRGGPGTGDPGMVSCENMNLAMLLTLAFDVPPGQIESPDWAEEPRFNVTARVSPGTTRPQLREMWRSLLVDRFGLAEHREQRVLPKYDLVIADGGPKFKEGSEPAEPKEDGAQAPRSHGPMRVDAAGFPELIRPGMIGVDGHIRLYQTRMTMDALAKILSAQLRRPVTDTTGLKGEYEIRLFWVREGAVATPRPERPQGGLLPPVAEGSGGPTLPRAVQDQLGLRLQSTRGPVEFVVVDHLEKSPTGN